MEVLVLAWDAVRGGGPGHRAMGLASSLARHGARVRLVTRLAEDEDATVLRRVEVHDVPDVAPLLPLELGSRQLRARGFATPALAVATRRLVERPADVTVAVGPDALEVATRLSTDAGTLVLDPDVRGTPDWEGLSAAAALLRSAGRDVVVGAPTPSAATMARELVDAPVLVLPAAGPAPRSRPGPPPPTGPVRLVVPPGVSHGRVARRLRTAFERARTRRVVTGTTRHRPAVVLVMDPDAGDAVLHGASRGVPVVAVPGTAGDLVTSLGCGPVVADERAAADECVALLLDEVRAGRLGEDALVASERARRDAVGALTRLLAHQGPGTSGDDVRPAPPGTDQHERARPLLRPVD